ncbi:cardiolipin synthase A [Rhodanobacter panaciterrae]|uniref:Cardiolipin synthase n=1 Tax=Rhodanobacter panaciterrae TaxID=490572 RepID=A0ABQ2ZG61_9GAMM|nr:cardiolipin synthase [Rhodanobacter panaciterrae]GGY13896.1 cardiolipin synthase A [Rhodanobacter panaciterrae]
MTASALTLGIALLHLLGMFAAMHAVMHTRTPQGAIGWALGLLLLPYVTLLPYLYLGSSRFLGYRVGHHPLSPRAVLAAADTHAIDPGCARFAAISALQGRPFRGGHRLRLLIDGEAAFDVMLAAMAAAEQCLLVQFFIIHDDALGRRLQQILLERAAAGVHVCVLFDGIGSHALPQHYVDTLRAGGVAIHRFATHRWRNRFQLNFRNHRKIVVVDGARAFVGGLNVGDEYLGLKPPLAPWRDTQLELHGAVVADLQQLFADDWQWITGAPPPLLPSPSGDGNASALVVASGPADPQETGSLFFAAAINAAQQRVWLSTPYYVPDHAVRAALQLAVLRGVDVRVLIPSRPDHRTVFLASTLHAYHAVRAGIRVFRYQPGFLHQKALLIDRDAAAIGSMNLDSRSFRLNFEVAALAVDPAFAADVAAMLTEDFRHAAAVDEREYRDAPYLRRVAMHVARLFDPLL